MAEAETKVDPVEKESVKTEVTTTKPETNGHTNGVDSPPVAKPEVNGESSDEPAKAEPTESHPHEHPEQNGTPTASPCHTSGPQPGVDTAGWLTHQKEKNLGKVAFVTLEWVYKATKVDVGKLPGAKRQSVTKEEFLGALKDGVVLAQLANVLKPGSVASVTEDPTDDKTKLKANVDGFLQFAKTEADLADEKLFDPQAVLDETVPLNGPLLAVLIDLALMSESKWSTEGISVEQLQKAAIRKGSMKDRLTKPFKKMGDSLGAVFRRNNSTGSPEKKKPAEKPAVPVENGNVAAAPQSTTEATPAAAVTVEHPVESPPAPQIPDIDVTEVTAVAQ